MPDPDARPMRRTSSPPTESGPSKRAPGHSDSSAETAPTAREALAPARKRSRTPPPEQSPAPAPHRRRRAPASAPGSLAYGPPLHSPPSRRGNGHKLRTTGSRAPPPSRDRKSTRL